jgi:hypothetical protein
MVMARRGQLDAALSPSRRAAIETSHVGGVAAPDLVVGITATLAAPFLVPNTKNSDIGD